MLTRNALAVLWWAQYAPSIFILFSGFFWHLVDLNANPNIRLNTLSEGCRRKVFINKPEVIVILGF